jgi:Mn-dependent DtxR family transcriptional regulator
VLKRVLQEMFTGNVHSRADLARRLGVSEGLLTQMMEDLGRKGYLKPISTALECSSGCCGSFQS